MTPRLVFILGMEDKMRIQDFQDFSGTYGIRI